MKRMLLLLCVATISTLATAQKSTDLVQFSGVVVTGDSLMPVPFATIINKENRGTISDYYGFFSFVSQRNDTIRFSAVGFRDAVYIIPDSLSSNRYSLIQILQPDTIELPEAQVYPWPSREQFKDAFVAANPASPDIINSRKNLAREAIRESVNGTPMDGTGNYNWTMAQYQSKLYYAGQYPSLTLLDPIAWSRFIKAWKRGDFKKKE